MFKTLFASRAARLFGAAAAAGVASLSWAQPAAPGSPSGPAPSPASGYRSAFEGYRPFVDEEAIPWQQANDTVRQVGGHAGIFGSQGDHGSHGGHAAHAASPTASGSAAEASAATPPAATGGQQTREAARRKVEQGSDQPHGHEGHGGSSGR